MKIIIAGAGKVGKTLARQLAQEDYDLTIIDSRSRVVRSIVEEYDVMGVQGNCATMSTLEEAGARNADLLIAATNADEINLLCCITAHSLNPSIHTIARIRNPEYNDQIYAMRDLLALNLVFNPEQQAALEIERLLKYPGFLKRDTFAKGRIEIVELKVDADSKLKDVPLSQMGDIVKCKVLVCVVVREGKALMPGGNFVLQEGDRIFVTAESHNLTRLLKNLGIITRKVNRVMICGGGRVSFYLCQRLEKAGLEVTVVDNNPERCQELAEQLPNTNVVLGDASDQEFLESEGLADYDALVNLTGMDELNMIIGLYGHTMGVPQIVTKVDHSENNRIFESIPVGSIVCPRMLCSNNVVRYVRAVRNQTGAASSNHMIAGGLAEALEFRVDAGVLHKGEPLKNIRIKPGILVVCISHGSVQEIPNGDSSFKEGDNVIVVANGSDVIYQLNDIFA